MTGECHGSPHSETVRRHGKKASPRRTGDNPRTVPTTNAGAVLTVSDTVRAIDAAIREARRAHDVRELDYLLNRRARLECTLTTEQRTQLFYER